MVGDVGRLAISRYGRVCDYRARKIDVSVTAIRAKRGATPEVGSTGCRGSESGGCCG